MTIKTTLVKRGALYKGEMGFFADDEMAGEDVALVKSGGLVMCDFYSPKTLEAQRYLWGLVYKTFQNTDYWLNKDKAMDWFKVRVGFTKPGRDPDTGEWVQDRPDSLTRISEEELRRLTELIINVICTEILPGISRDDLRREVEEMIGVRT